MGLKLSINGIWRVMKKIVKLVNRGSLADEESVFKKQSLNNKAVWGDCIFTFNPLEENYDWLVVVDDIPHIIPNRAEQLKCPKENTILMTTEPTSITRYGRAFAGQFGHLITNQDEKILPHKNATRSQTGNVWFYGRDYDSIVSVKNPTKTKKLSTVCSNKQQGHTMHKLRYNFTELMQKEILELERFGRGHSWIDIKAEALDKYEFHVAIENHIAPDAWTEKLADAFLGFCVPIYCGCPNVYDYFPKDSLIQIDIEDTKGSIKKIKKIISTEGEYKKRLESVKEARRRVVEEYNIFAMISKIVENSKKSTFTPNQKIYSRRVMRARYLPDFFRFASFRVDNFFKEVKNGK